MAGAKIQLTAVSGELRTDGNDNARVNLPVDGTKAGYSQHNYVRDSATSRPNKVTEEGEAWASATVLEFSSEFNGAAAGAIVNNAWNQQATTMTCTYNGGFARFNNGAVTTINTGVSLNTWTTFVFHAGQSKRLTAHVRHTQGAISNKQFDIGFGYYDVAANQANAMNEFAGFRWTTAGALIGVWEYSTGGAATSLTVNINGAVPFSDSVARAYEVIVSANRVEFWVAGVYQAEIVRPNDLGGPFKSAALPIVARLFNSGSAPASAPVFDVGKISVESVGGQESVPVGTQQALMGRHSAFNQGGLTASNGNTANIPASGTAPTATTGSNTAAAIATLGGWYQLNGASIIATVQSNVIVCGYQNPVIPETAGVATDARPLVITGLSISPMVVGTVLVGGGATWTWFAATGATALSLATADAIGGAAIGTKSPRVTVLPVTDSIGAAAAVGTVATRAGNSEVTLETPIVVNPGEFFVVGLRIMTAAAAITSGAFVGGIGVRGYWL